MASYRKNLTLSLGPISTQVDLEAAAPTKKSPLNRICPQHTIKLSQSYKCPGTGEAEAHEVPWNTWRMGKPTEDGYTVVNEETKPTVESSPGLKVTPVPREQLESSTFEGPGLYYAKPSSEHQYETWGIFAKLVEGDTALVARGALRKGTEKLWRVTSFNGYLVLREILFPENLRPSPVERGSEADDEMLGLVGQFVDKMHTEWVDFDSSDAMATRLEAWMTDGEDYVADEAAPAPVVDLKAQLAAMLEEV